MTYSPQYFPLQIPPSWKASRDVIRSDGTKCPNSKSLVTYTSRGQRWPIERPILYDNFGESRSGGLQHGALDINCAWGSPVVAPRASRTLTTWTYQGEVRPGVGHSEKGGWYVWLQDDLGYKHYFAHLASQPLVRSGERIQANQLLGYCGASGNAEGGCSHLHYAVTAPNGQKYNPFRELDAIYTAGRWQGTPIGFGQSWFVPVFALAGVGIAAWWLVRRAR